MTAFHGQNWRTREGTMGDIAENVFEQVSGGRFHRLGLNRVWADGRKLYLGHLTAAQRYTPDYLDMHGFVEVMGCGTDQVLKLKDEKLEALLEWSLLGETRLFVYDSKNNRYWDDRIPAWMQAFYDHNDRGTFPEGKVYWKLPTRKFPCQAVEVE